MWVAAAGAQRALLQAEFPRLSFVELPGYGVKYGKNRALTVLRLIYSVPKILIRIKEENAWLRRFQASVGVDVVISDNRWGLYLEGVESVFITHQLKIRTPFGLLADGLVQRMNYVAIRRFSRCWIPDEADGRFSLAGDLSHPSKKPTIPLRYIGCLSRFGVPAPLSASANDAALSSAFDLLVLLSGPEPQRTLLERTILEQSAATGIRIVLVRGLPGGGSPDLVFPSNVKVFAHLPAESLEPLIRSAGLVLARSGYSTIMDLMRLGKKAILIPTPGQTEQEYLGSYLAGKGLAFCIDQRRFALAGALAMVRDQRLGPSGQQSPEGVRPMEGGGLAAAVQEVLAAVTGR